MESIFLTEEGYRLLEEQFVSGLLPEFNKQRLLLDLQAAQVISSDNMPLNVVNTDTNVLVTNLDKHQTFSVHISSMQDVTSTSNIISCTDSLAIALMGYSPGAIIPWEFEERIHNLQVISVCCANHHKVNMDLTHNNVSKPSIKNR